MLDYYGLTESYPLVANYPFMDVREGSMGRPMPGWDVRILDEDERPVAQGERGEICLRARSNPHYPLGYWRNEEAAKETFGGGWFHTKDAASTDEDGYFWYEGRADDVIIAAGYRIGPFEVESACLEHAAVREAAAVASPDERRGNVVKAFIVLVDGARAVGRARQGDPGARARPAVRLRLSAQDRVRGRPAEDADRQDPADRAAPARGGVWRAAPHRRCAKLVRGAAWLPESGRAARAHSRRRCDGSGPAARLAQPVTRALVPQWAARLLGLAALGAIGALEWQRLIGGYSSGRALLWMLAAVVAAVADAGRRARVAPGWRRALALAGALVLACSSATCCRAPAWII